MKQIKSKQINETPILIGEDAIKFQKARETPIPIPKEKIEEMIENYRLLKSIGRTKIDRLI